MRTKLFVLLAIIATALGCNTDKQNGNQAKYTPDTKSDNKIQTEPKQDELANNDEPSEYVDSFKIKMDSLLTAKIKLPPVYYHDVMSAEDEATTKFTKLSAASNGKMKILVNSNMVANEIAASIKQVSVDKSDLLLLIDKTYSMTNDIANVKAGLSQIIDTIKKYKGVRLAIAFYGDKNVDGMEWYSFRNFETRYEEAQEYLNAVRVTGGGDIPESVYDAFFKSLQQDFWKSTKKCNIIIVGDAPPLEKPLSDYSIDDVIKEARARKIIMNFYPIIIMPAISEVKLSPTEAAKYQEIKLVTTLYPNPTKGHIDVGLEESGSYYMELYNSAGQMVITEQFFGLSWSKELGNLPDGMYILRIINSDHKFELVKFIIQK